MGLTCDRYPICIWITISIDCLSQHCIEKRQSSISVSQKTGIALKAKELLIKFTMSGRIRMGQVYWHQYLRKSLKNMISLVGFNILFYRTGGKQSIEIMGADHKQHHHRDSWNKINRDAVPQVENVSVWHSFGLVNVKCSTKCSSPWICCRSLTCQVWVE